MVNKTVKILLMVVGVLLVLNALINIFDDGMILAYDITSILSGVGFILVVFVNNSRD